MNQNRQPEDRKGEQSPSNRDKPVVCPVGTSTEEEKRSVVGDDADWLNGIFALPNDGGAKDVASTWDSTDGATAFGVGSLGIGSAGPETGLGLEALKAKGC